VFAGAAVIMLLGRTTATGPGGELPVAAPRGAPVVSGESQDAITAAVAQVGPAVVNINTIFKPPARTPQEEWLRQFFGAPAEPFPRRGQGSGIIIDEERGYILTNAHVVRGAAQVRVSLSDGRSFEARVVGSDPLSEIALLKIPGGDLPSATLGSTEGLAVGSWVIAIGNPFGFENSVTVGVVSAKDRQIRVPDTGHVLSDLLQTDASINPGNSGGALVDLNGNVVGVPTAIIPFAQGIGFAVAVDVAKQVAERLISTGKVPWLGVTHQALLPEQAARLEVPDGKGTLVVAVDPRGPAAKGGVKPGDVILRVGDQAVEAAKALGSAVRSYDVGTRVEVLVWREGREVKLDVTLDEVPSEGLR
jgi:serine protease Do